MYVCILVNTYAYYRDIYGKRERARVSEREKEREGVNT